MMKYPKKMSFTKRLGKCNMLHINYIWRENHIIKAAKRRKSSDGGKA